jgi:hypothetical protein
VEPCIDLFLSHGDLLDVSCDKDELCANASILHADAKHKHVKHIMASANDKLKLLFSLHTLG